MHLQSLLLPLLATISLTAAQNSLDCPLAKDDSAMIQNPYCCDSSQKAPHTDKAIEGLGCTSFTAPTEKCPNGNEPLCCYEIGPKKICTTKATVQPE